MPKRLSALLHESRGLETADAGEPAIVPDDQIATVFPWTEDPMLETPTFSRERFLIIESSRARQVSASSEGYFTPLLAWLDRILAEAGDTPIGFMVIPDEMQVEEGLWRDVQARVGNLELDRDQPQRVLEEYFRSRGATFVDLLSILRAAPPLEDGNRHFYQLRDTHLNTRGNRKAGEALAGLVERLLGRR